MKKTVILESMKIGEDILKKEHPLFKIAKIIFGVAILVILICVLMFLLI